MAAGGYFRAAVETKMRTKRIISAGLLCAVLLFASLLDGSKAVTTAGTRVQLSSTQILVVSLSIQASSSNTGVIYVGGPTISSTRGVALSAGDTLALLPMARQNEYYDLRSIWLDASVSAEGVTYAYRPR